MQQRYRSSRIYAYGIGFAACRSNGDGGLRGGMDSVRAVASAPARSVAAAVGVGRSPIPRRGSSCSGGLHRDRHSTCHAAWRCISRHRQAKITGTSTSVVF